MIINASGPDMPEPSRDDSLHLTSVLASALPDTVGTAEEPATYTVPVVFSRQVTQRERKEIEDPAFVRSLPHAGPDVLLAVSDRRLLIKNTNLAQLRQGLAADLAAGFRGVSVRAASEDAQRSLEAATRRSAEQTQRERVATAAAGIRFQ